MSVCSAESFCRSEKKDREKEKIYLFFFSHSAPKCRRVHRSSSLQFREKGGIHFCFCRSISKRQKSYFQISDKCRRATGKERKRLNPVFKMSDQMCLISEDIHQTYTCSCLI
ncbi:hypothetical protein CEXT_6971 [Caerostris extrusa]|uniref:Uncharacterized protein n=1 Tax=Caerostris extrusa TaxID=172846 RepID=A0AAV4UM93_CAEEX|nr:hypothetical protein CEXT_6971 [Caerostris extrusa]